MPTAFALHQLPGKVEKGSIKFTLEVIKGTEVLHYCYKMKTATIEQEDYEDLLNMIEKALSKRYKFPKYIAAADINASGRNGARQILVDLYWKLPKSSLEIIQEAGKDKNMHHKGQYITDPKVIDLRASRLIRKQAKEEDSKEWEMCNELTGIIRPILYTDYPKVKRAKIREKKKREE